MMNAGRGAEQVGCALKQVRARHCRSSDRAFTVGAEPTTASRPAPCWNIVVAVELGTATVGSRAPSSPARRPRQRRDDDAQRDADGTLPDATVSTSRTASPRGLATPFVPADARPASARTCSSVLMASSVVRTEGRVMTTGWRFVGLLHRPSPPNLRTISSSATASRRTVMPSTRRITAKGFCGSLQRGSGHPATQLASPLRGQRAAVKDRESSACSLRRHDHSIRQRIHTPHPHRRASQHQAVHGEHQSRNRSTTTTKVARSRSFGSIHRAEQRHELPTLSARRRPACGTGEHLSRRSPSASSPRSALVA